MTCLDQIAYRHPYSGEKNQNKTTKHNEDKLHELEKTQKQLDKTKCDYKSQRAVADMNFHAWSLKKKKKKKV